MSGTSLVVGMFPFRLFVFAVGTEVFSILAAVDLGHTLFAKLHRFPLSLVAVHPLHNDLDAFSPDSTDER